MQIKKETVVFGGGCFWCTEAVFEELEGIISVMPGYAGGAKPNPTYEEVCDGATGHAEVIKIEYSPEKITFKDLLIVFFYTHDPTTLNKQGNDVGEQYRSVIFYTNDSQKKEAEEVIKELNDSKAYSKPVITEVKLLDKFYEAENYHKNYYQSNPNNSYCQLIIAPKLEKFRHRFENLLRKKSGSL